MVDLWYLKSCVLGFNGEEDEFCCFIVGWELGFEIIPGQNA